MNALEVKYLIEVVVSDKVFDRTFKFEKEFSVTITKPNEVLYDNYHYIEKRYILDYFTAEINQYTYDNDIADSITGTSDFIVEEFEIFSKTKGVEVFFENEENAEEFTLYPTVKAYVYPISEKPKEPVLRGSLVDDVTIKWEWDEDGYSHFIVDENRGFVAQVPLGVTSYLESGLEYNTPYTRMLVADSGAKTSDYSKKVTILTSDIPEDDTTLTNYSETINKGYEEEIISVTDEKLSAFHSGVGYGEDCLITKGEKTDIDIDTVLEFNLLGKGSEGIEYYPKVSFGYRNTLDAKYKELTRDGNLTIRTKAYPIEYAKLRLYKYALVSLDVKWKITGKVTYMIKDGTTYKSKTHSLEVGGTYKLNDNLSNVVYSDKGYATIKPINVALGNGTIGSMLAAEASKLSDFSNAISGNTHFHEIRIYDNYATDCDETYRQTDSMSTSHDGSFRICQSGTGRPSTNDSLYAIGHADAQLYTYESFKEGEFNMHDNDGPLEIFSQSEVNAPLKCVANSSLTYTGSNVEIKVESVKKGSNIIVNNNGGNITIEIGKVLDSGNKTYQFSLDNPNLTLKYGEMFAENNESQDSKFRFVTEVISCSENIYHNSSVKLSSGSLIKEIGYINSYISFEAKSYFQVKTYNEIFPPMNEDCLHGTVNGRDDEGTRVHRGKRDFVVTAHKFAIDHRFYDIKYGVIIDGAINPSGATLAYNFISSNSDTSQINADVMMFKSNYGVRKGIAVEEVVSSKTVGVNINTKLNTRVDTDMALSGDISIYDTFELSVKSRNPEIIISDYSKDIRVSGNKCDVYAVLKAIDHPSSKWCPSVHNGYYYLNQHENYIYSNDKAVGLRQEVIQEIGYGNVSFNVLVTTKNGTKIVKGYSFRIKFDKNEYTIVDDINTLIQPWLDSIGVTQNDIKNLEIVQIDNDTNLSYDSAVTSTDNTPDMGDIFNTWYRFSHGRPEYDNEKNAWRWNDQKGLIECTINSNNYIGFVSEDKLSKYKAKVRFSSTCTWDNDSITFVIAHAIDPNGNEHTLSVIRDFNSNSNQWYAHYNKGLPGSRTISNKSSHLTEVAGSIWSQYLPEGSFVYVEREGNIIKAKTSNAGQRGWVESSEIVIDLSADPALRVFLEPCSYGFGCCSQTYSTFDEIEIIDYKNVLGEIKASSKEILYVDRVLDFVEVTDKEFIMSPLPQQFCPITIESEKYGLLTHVENIDGNIGSYTFNEEYLVTENGDTVVLLSNSNICSDKLSVLVNDVATTDFTLKNNALIFNEAFNVGDCIKVSYELNNTFTVQYDIDNDRVKISTNTKEPIGKSIVSYETSKHSNTKILEHLSLNPVHNTIYNGFVYIDDEMREPCYISIRTSVKSMFNDIDDRTRVYVEILDVNRNPIENEAVSIIVSKGTINADSISTDINGVVASTYIPPSTTGTVTITATCGGLAATKNITIKERVM